METKKIFDPASNLLIEERDFKFWGLKLVGRRKYDYSDNGQLLQIEQYSGSNKLVRTQQFFYNLASQLYLETSINKRAKGESKSYYIYNDLGQVIKVLGERENQHQYLHEFSYNDEGVRVNGIKATLVPDSSLKRKYEQLLQL